MRTSPALMAFLGEKCWPPNNYNHFLLVCNLVLAAPLRRP